MTTLAVVLACYTVVVNLSPAPPDPRDRPALARAHVGCRAWLGPAACLVKFTRVEPGRYWAVCRR